MNCNFLPYPLLNNNLPWCTLFYNKIFSFLKNDLPRLPAWPKISLRVSSGPMPSKRPIAQGFSQLVRSSDNSNTFFLILKLILRPTYKSNLQLTKTQGLWLDTLRHTMNTIWYDKISPMKRNFFYHPLLMFTVTMKVAYQPFLCLATFQNL